MGGVPLKKSALSVVCMCFIFVFLGSEHSSSEIPEIKKQCDLCHRSHAMGGAILLNKPLSDLCLDCHPDRKAPGDHIVDVVPSMDVGGLPLLEGKMTCVTCHDPHEDPFGRMLRADPDKLCRYCHRK